MTSPLWAFAPFFVAAATVGHPQADAPLLAQLGSPSPGGFSSPAPTVSLAPLTSPVAPQRSLSPLTSPAPQASPTGLPLATPRPPFQSPQPVPMSTPFGTPLPGGATP